MSGGELRALADEQSALRRIATVVARGAAPEAVFDRVAREVARVLRVHRVTIDRYEHGTSSTVLASVNDPGFPVGSHWPLDGPSLAAIVLETGRTARVDDYRDLQSTSAAVAREYSITSAVGVPILVDGDVWGVICVGSTDPEPLPPDTERRLAAFTDLLETAISSAHARAELTRLADAEAALRRVATLVARGAPPAEVFAGVAEEVARVLDIRPVTIDRYDSDGASTVVAATGSSGSRFTVGSRWPLDGPSLAATVLKTGCPARVDDYADLPSSSAAAAREYGITSTVGVPIVVDGAVWGVVCVGSIDQKKLPADTEERLSGFTELLETAISNAHSRAELARLAEEQAALRRVATLVARGAPPDEMFQGVALEVARLLDIRTVTIDRYDPDAASTVVASTGSRFNVGSRWPLDGPSLGATVLETRSPARVDDYTDLQSSSAAAVRAFATTSTVGVPILADGAVWGVICVGTNQPEPLPADTERRLAAFTELLETAISNAHSRAELIASRTRIATAADETRRRIERDLHDGTQQRLVSLGLELRGARQLVPLQLRELDEALSHVSEELTGVFEELRRISQGIHPAILSEGGLEPALHVLRRRSMVPVSLDVHLDRRLPERVEVATYYVVSEALTNAAKHAAASGVSVMLDERSSWLRVEIRDDGIGGAEVEHGSGLVGLRDRVEAIGGALRVSSPAGGGTALLVDIPLAEPLAMSGPLTLRGPGTGPT